ncbi:MAG TPA: carotenoid biosynthesis protein [Roseiflexaceae bacterium]|jgi:uncharacterized membrane protein|nr:carotenoid biosynthesis protein [Roseiflexaceae bacterium]
MFLVFEIAVYLLAMLCLWHACVRGWAQVGMLLAGMIYGLFFEYMAIETFHAYRYGSFLIMLFDAVPLCIGVSWGMIIYTAMATSDRFALPWYLRPVLDALLALQIDLSMDAIAIRMGFWRWATPGPWFGVPLGNFYAWFVVVFGFSLMVRLGCVWRTAGRGNFLANVIVAAVTVPLSVVGCIALLRPYASVLLQGTVGWSITGMLVIGSSLLALWAARRTRRDHELDLLAVSVAMFFHVFFFAGLLWNGIIWQVPLLVPISASVATAGLLLHLWPSWNWFRWHVVARVAPATSHMS